MILRLWSSRIRSEQAYEYAGYVRGTGLRDYGETPGNLGSQVLLRDLGDGSTQVTTLSWWDSLDSIRSFAGAALDRAVYYPEDDRFLLEKPLTVEHHEVVAGEVTNLKP